MDANRQALARTISALQDPASIDTNAKTIVRTVLDGLSNFLCRLMDSRMFALVTSPDAKTQPLNKIYEESEERGDSSGRAFTGTCPIAICNNQADGSAHKNNIFSNDIIAMRASQAVINGNTSSEDAKMNNMILSHEALKLFTVSGSSGFLGGGT
ncbi:hypothetical protein MGN70_001647 [Eutypa lata]|nr:hypothetical protein MGN70_001647 [Eutypa lata]